MQSKSMEKYIKISRIVVTLLVFVVLNSWFLYERDPQWIPSIIISALVFLISFPSSKICELVISKGDRIGSKIFKVVFYAFALPIIFILLLFAVGLLSAFAVEFFIPADSLNLGLAVLIAFAGIGIFTCVLVPYFQTLIILILRYFLNFEGGTNKKG